MRHYFEISDKCFVSVEAWDYNGSVYRLNTFFHADLSHLFCLTEQDFKKHKDYNIVLNI